MSIGLLAAAGEVVTDGRTHRTHRITDHYYGCPHGFLVQNVIRKTSLHNSAHEQEKLRNTIFHRWVFIYIPTDR